MATYDPRGITPKERQELEVIKSACLMAIKSLECKLSPENLHCDGERPRHIALRLGREYEALKKKEVSNFKMITKMLEGKAREPTFDEIWR